MKEENKRTKIVATIGPSSGTVNMLKQLIEAGLNVARINFSHGTHEKNLELVEHVREAAQAVGQPVAILVDLQGPKIRVGSLGEEGLELVEGQMATIQAGVESADPGVIPVPYDRLSGDVAKGDRILLEDGTKELEVLEVRGPLIKTKVLLGGRLISHKGINVPTTSLSVDAITEKDEEDLAFALQHDVDFVALSFVTSAAQIEDLRKKIGQYLPEGMEPPAVIVKVEKHEAIRHFAEILEAVDGVMIARGDLGLETPAAAVPVRQKELIAQCVVAGKPVITATEMLASMEQRPRPTRAETSDVANAVIDHTDAVMLSAETATGRYPARAVETMTAVITATEESPLDDLIPHEDSVGEPVPLAVGAAAVALARHLQATAIVVTTRSGYSARAVARFRPEIPIWAATDRVRTRQQLLLSWGVQSLDVSGYEDPAEMTQATLDQLQENGALQSGDTVVVVSGLQRQVAKAGAEGGKYDSGIRVVEV